MIPKRSFHHGAPCKIYMYMLPAPLPKLQGKWMVEGSYKTTRLGRWRQRVGLACGVWLSTLFCAGFAGSVPSSVGRGEGTVIRIFASCSVRCSSRRLSASAGSCMVNHSRSKRTRLPNSRRPYHTTPHYIYSHVLMRTELVLQVSWQIPRYWRAAPNRSHRTVPFPRIPGYAGARQCLG